MFQPVTFTPPSSVDSIAAGLSSSLDAIGSTLASGAGRLASLGGASSAPVPGLNGMGDMAHEQHYGTDNTNWEEQAGAL